jgi:N-acetylglucosaminyldiphosphoundecaprenol N-acetyl-beta-D-mannosaminyltransferase
MLPTDPAHPPLAQKRVAVLGTALDVTTYADLAEDLWQAAKLPGTLTIEFANTHIITMRRHDSHFREVTDSFDRFVPDGMPLVWCMNRHGAGMPDRVYGPTFFRYFFERDTKLTHYLLGGSEETGRLLRAAMLRSNPKIQIVGSYHGMCKMDGEMANPEIIDEINRLSPDCIWLGLGAPKQQCWVNKYRGQIKRGIIMTVGFAFDVNAGTKKDAPPWMQRIGLTWLFRLLTEPRRLAVRYLRYNTLFVWYMIRDAFARRENSRAA